VFVAYARFIAVVGSVIEPPAVSVGWLVAQRDLDLRVRAGADGLRREIRWAHCIELPDPTPWLQGGELVLTTGLRLPRSADGQRRYVQRLDGAGVTALALGTGLTHRRVPATMIEEADQLGLPLLEVPYATPFEALTTAVLERIAERRYAQVARASGVQSRMTRAALRGGPAAVVRELAAATGGRAFLIAPDRSVEAAHPGGVPSIADVRERLPGPGATSLVDAGPDGVTTVEVVRVGRRLHGHLMLETGAPLSQVERVLFGHAVSLIALGHELPARHEARRRRVDQVVVGLLTGAVPAAELAAEQLADGALRVLVARPSRPDRAADRIVRALAHRSAPTLVRVVGEEVVAILTTGDDGTDLVGGLHAGLSRAHPPSEGPAALAEARTAMAVAEARRCPVVAFDELAGMALVTSPASRAVLDQVAAARLAPLAAHDRRHGTTLVVSLRAFLEHHGQWESAATALGVHRHTLRTRIVRAQQVLDCDLDDAHVRAELLLSLSVWEP
jgi:PucR family transcriptional regulator, purine catabolism regulatory protein